MVPIKPDCELVLLSEEVGRRLRVSRQTVSVAESCTGGLVCKILTDVPGSSDYFVQGLITYSNASKTRLLGVPAELIAERGAVCAEVAEAMARGCQKASNTDWAIAVTGIAGPSGGTLQKPVGLVYACITSESIHIPIEMRWESTLSRLNIRQSTTHKILQEWLEKLNRRIGCPELREVRGRS